MQKKKIHAITKIICKFGLKKKQFFFAFLCFCRVDAGLNFFHQVSYKWFTQIKTLFKQLHWLYFRPPTNTLGI